MRLIELPVEEMVSRYIAGEGSLALGRAYGVDHGVILHRLHAAGVTVRPVGFHRHKRGGPLSSNNRGYLCTRGRSGKQYLLHRACWEAHHGPIPPRHIIHHINGDPRDNRVENLACMTQGEHNRLHAPKRKEAP